MTQQQDMSNKDNSKKAATDSSTTAKFSFFWWLRHLAVFRFLNRHGLGLTNVTLCVVLLAAFAVRYPGTGEGLPYSHYWDEPFVLHETLDMMRTGNLVPDYWLYPHGYMYLSLPFASLGYLQAVRSDRFNGPRDLITRDITHYKWTVAHPAIYKSARTMTVLFAVATVAMAFCIGRRLAGRLAGLSAAILAAFHPLIAEQSTKVTVDMPGAAFAMGAALAAFALLKDPQRRGRWLLLGGILVGCSTATKYTNYPVAAVLVLAYVLHPRVKNLFSPSIALLPLGMVLGFLGMMPGAALNMPDFLFNIGYQFSRLTSEGIQGNWLASFGERLRAACGPLLDSKFDLVVLGLCVVALVLSVLQLRKRLMESSLSNVAHRRIAFAISLFGAAAFTWGSMLKYYIFFERYLVPVVLIAIIPFAGVGCALIGRQFSSVTRWIPATPLLLATLVITLSLSYHSERIETYRRPETRLLAADWLNEHAMEGAVIAAPAELHFAIHSLRKDLRLVETNIASLPILADRRKDITHVILPTAVSFWKSELNRELPGFAAPHLNAARAYPGWTAAESFSGGSTVLDAPAKWPGVVVLERGAGGTPEAPPTPSRRMKYTSFEAQFESMVSASDLPGVVITSYTAGRLPVNLPDRVKQVGVYAYAKKMNDSWPVIQIALQNEKGETVGRSPRITIDADYHKEFRVPLEAPAGEWTAVIGYHWNSAEDSSARPTVVVGQLRFFR